MTNRPARRLAIASTLAVGTIAGAHPGEIMGSGLPLTNTPVGWESRGVRVLGHLPVSDLGPGATFANDCWGYTTPTGREIAIIGTTNGTAFVDVTDPTTPQGIGFFSGPGSPWRDIKCVGTHAYSVNESGGGIQVFDLSEADAGIVTERASVGSGDTHNIAADTDSGFIYRTGGGDEDANPPNGLRIYDAASNPDAPTLVGTWNDHYVHDAQVVTYNDGGPWDGRQIAFCCTGFDLRLRILDVTDKQAITELGEVRYSAARYSHQGWLSPDRQHFYLNDELDERQLGNGTTTRIIDVSDLTNPTEVGTFLNGNGSIDHNLYTKDDLVFASNYRSGLRVFDATNPLAISEVAYLDTFISDDLPEFDGVWSNYPYFQSGTVVISDIQQGLVLAEVNLERIDFEFPNGVPSQIDPTGNTVVSFTATGVGVTLDPATVRLNVDTGSGVVQVDALTIGNTMGIPIYEANIPPIECAGTARYWVSADSTAGDTSFGPASAPTFPLEATIVSSDITVFADDFETDLDWAVTSDPELTGGAWARGTPLGGGDRGDPPTDFDGSGQCFLTDPADGNTDVDGGRTLLLSPRFDGTGGDPICEVAIWFVNQLPTAPPSDDTMLIEISNDNGTNWTLLDELGPATVQAWLERRYPLAPVITPTDSMRVRFIAQDLNDGSLVEAGIDAFRVGFSACCRTDYTGDGVIDVLDLLAFLSSWFDTEPRADFNGDSVVDVLDLLAFLGEWFPASDAGACS